jgi:antitoxin Phd
LQKKAKMANIAILEGVMTIRMDATTVKNRMGHVLDKVIEGEIVLITRHDSPKAALIPMAEFERLRGAGRDPLDELSREYDAMLARMQEPASRKRMKAAFDASPQQIARAAQKFARKRA